MFLATDSELAGPKAKSSRPVQYDQLLVPLRYHPTAPRRYIAVGFHVKHFFRLKMDAVVEEKSPADLGIGTDRGTD
jgi:hypothetical protein